jgi:predicted DNA-binding protein YlxM (UPF0122 family)
MLTLRQEKRLKPYRELLSLAKVAECEGVSRESIRQSLDSLAPDSEEYQEFKTIAEAEKGGRPRQYETLQEQRRENIRNWRAKQKQQKVAEG